MCSCPTRVPSGIAGTSYDYSDPSERLLFHALKPRVRHALALVGAEIRDFLQQKGEGTFRKLSLNVKEVCAIHVVEHECRAHVFLGVTDLDIIELDALHMS